jgi:hypothetical protein
MGVSMIQIGDGIFLVLSWVSEAQIPFEVNR